jgi:hypothetical protein
MEIKGGCLCGAVRYTAEADPTSATVCHCRDCRKFTGSAFAALVRVTKEAVNIEGTLKTFSSTRTIKIGTTVETVHRQVTEQMAA